ncbi:hypothetical protein B5S31_g4047 [[Candida] boidinii]|nr:hypothetical protein B5S31_g4047 [[Candida] boidinii]OWB78008.1 hypothetical protein B5S32_g2193 [[Candida] boidinii]
MQFSRASLLSIALALSVKVQADQADYLTAYYEDINNNINDYLSYVAANPTVPGVQELLALYQNIRTYTDDSYTTLANPGLYTTLSDFATGLPWYSTRLGPELSSAAAIGADASVAASSAPASSSAVESSAPASTTEESSSAAEETSSVEESSSAVESITTVTSSSAPASSSAAKSSSAAESSAAVVAGNSTGNGTASSSSSKGAAAALGFNSMEVLGAGALALGVSLLI